MRPLHLNLASEPWKETRGFWMVVASASILILALLANNVDAAIEYFVETEETRAEIAEISASTAETVRKAEELEALQEGRDEALIQERVEYVNARIRERAFSWSQLLDHLERVVPADARVRALLPRISEEGPISLNMRCVAKDQDAFVQMIRNMTADAHFDQPYPTTERTSEDGSVAFTLNVTYRPDPPGVVVP